MGALLQFENETTAVIVQAIANGESQKLATVYKLKDGWHSKRADLHTAQAWSGPYSSAEDALVAFRTEEQRSQLV
jgi:hypothetical protein